MTRKIWCFKDKSVVSELCPDCDRSPEDCPEMVPAEDYEDLISEALDELDLPELNHWKSKNLAEYAKGMIIVCRNAIDQLKSAEDTLSKIIEIDERRRASGE